MYEQEEASLEEVLKSAGNVNTFLGLVEDAGLMDVLREGGEGHWNTELNISYI